MNADIVFLIRTAHIEGRSLRGLRRELRALIAPGRQLVLDLSGVERANAHCAGMILEIAAGLRKAGGRLTLVGMRSGVAAFFEILRLNRVVDMTRTRSNQTTAPLAA